MTFPMRSCSIRPTCSRVCHEPRSDRRGRRPRRHRDDAVHDRRRGQLQRWRLRQRRLFRHVLPAAANPLISLFPFSAEPLLSASLLIEVVMGWPGLGPLFLEAIMARDFALVLAVVMLSAAFLVVGNLLADISRK